MAKNLCCWEDITTLAIKESIDTGSFSKFFVSDE